MHVMKILLLVLLVSSWRVNGVLAGRKWLNTFVVLKRKYLVGVLVESYFRADFIIVEDFVMVMVVVLVTQFVASLVNYVNPPTILVLFHVTLHPHVQKPTPVKPSFISPVPAVVSANQSNVVEVLPIQQVEKVLNNLNVQTNV